MNELLFISSLIVSFIFMIIYYLLYDESLLFLYFTTFFGSVTSILNHGISNTIFKCIDRFAVAICAIIYFFYILFRLDPIYMYLALIYIMNAMSFYFVSKLTKKNMYHLMTHLLIVPLFLIWHL